MKGDGEVTEMIALSDAGRVRRNNEDAFAFDSTAGVAVLADGMGGLDAGEVASTVAVEAIIDALQGVSEPGEGALASAIEVANAAVRQAAERAQSDMGTTVVVWLSNTPGQCFVAHVGDSRVYRLRDGALRQLTADHSIVQQMIDDGVLSEVEARTSIHRNVITRALGLEARVQVDVRSWVYVPGDLFLLCSDGLTDMVTDEEINRVLCDPLGGSPGSLANVAEALVASANEAGGNDNISVLLVRPVD